MLFKRLYYYPQKLQVAAADAIRKENEAKERHVGSVNPKHLEPETLVETFTSNIQATSSESRQATDYYQDFKSKSSLEQKVEDSETHKSPVTEATKQVHFEKDQEQVEYHEEYEHGYDHNEDSDCYYNEVSIMLIHKSNYWQ